MPWILSGVRPGAGPAVTLGVGVERNGSMQPIEKEYADIPGTTVFDAEQSRKGYGINMFCMSLLKDANRKAFKADEAG